MVPKRSTNPSEAELEPVEQQLLAGEGVVVQFDERVYTKELLERVDSLAARFGSLLEVRFYSHLEEPFDFAVLEKLPAVANLSVDCLREASNVDALASLSRLEVLSIGVDELSDAKVLRHANLRSLRELTVGPTNSKAIELSFLADFTRLELLRICGHTRGILALEAIPALATLALHQIGKQQPLGFVSRLSKLRVLQLLLGGRSSIAEIELPDLRELEISLVKGLTDLGAMARFRGLTSLVVDDQARVETIEFSAENSELRMIRAFNCKALRALPGLDTLPKLQHLRIGRTALDRDALLALPLPPSLEICAMYTRKERDDEPIRAALAARGYRER